MYQEYYIFKLAKSIFTILCDGNILDPHSKTTRQHWETVYVDNYGWDDWITHSKTLFIKTQIQTKCDIIPHLKHYYVIQQTTLETIGHTTLLYKFYPFQRFKMNRIHHLRHPLLNAILTYPTLCVPLKFRSLNVFISFPILILTLLAEQPMYSNLR